MKCAVCRTGTTQQKSTTVTLKHASSPMVFHDVQALVCDACGETCVDEKTAGDLLDSANRATGFAEVKISGDIVSPLAEKWTYDQDNCPPKKRTNKR